MARHWFSDKHGNSSNSYVPGNDNDEEDLVSSDSDEENDTNSEDSENDNDNENDTNDSDSDSDLAMEINPARKRAHQRRVGPHQGREKSRTKERTKERRDKEPPKSRTKQRTKERRGKSASKSRTKERRGKSGKSKLKSLVDYDSDGIGFDSIDMDLAATAADAPQTTVRRARAQRADVLANEYRCHADLDSFVIL
jgi:hypothetical protein